MQFVEQRERVINGKAVAKNQRHDNPSLASRNHNDPMDAMPDDEDDKDDPYSRYKRQHRTLDMRCRILRNEMIESKELHSRAATHVSTAQAVLKHMKDEESQLHARMQQLSMEIQVVQSQVQAQEAKHHRVQLEEQHAKEKHDLIERTLVPLEQECEKMRVILQGFESHI